MSLTLGGKAAVAAGVASILGYIDTVVNVDALLISDRLPAIVQNIVSFFVQKYKPKPEYFNKNEAKEYVVFFIIDRESLETIGRKIGEAITVTVRI